VRGAVCGSHGVCAVTDDYAGGYADADADRHVAYCGCDWYADVDAHGNDNENTYVNVGPAHGCADANEGAGNADAHSDADWNVGYSDEDRNAGSADGNADAFARANYNARTYELACPDRDPEGNVGYAKGNSDDGGDQDSDGCRHVHA
jgi:hypothetical protein